MCMHFMVRYIQYSAKERLTAILLSFAHIKTIASYDSSVPTTLKIKCFHLYVMNNTHAKNL